MKLNKNDVLIVVDPQIDFADDCEGATLPVPGAGKTIPVINKLMGMFKRVIGTADWHPINHVSFETWPVHCVAGTIGANWHPDLNADAFQVVVRKGTNKDLECYSGFGAGCINLAHAVWDSWPVDDEQRVFVCGWAEDYCVKATAMDAVKAGFKQVYVVSDAIAGVAPETTAQAVKEMQEAGIKFVTSAELETLEG